LAVSLHCASDEERDALLPANRRYGGLDALLASLQEYQEGTSRRITLEWALIRGVNDNVETARKLGNLLTKRGQLRRDLLHINVRTGVISRRGGWKMPDSVLFFCFFFLYDVICPFLFSRVGLGVF
jgi:adenine C2-methylase RlmN of 23S rRNA A2503 and tRNA A37